MDMEKLIKQFLHIQGDVSGYGSGYGYGSGFGDGSGSGDGYGSGSGEGYGPGSGYGSGYGDGDGSGYGSGYGYGYGKGEGSGDGSGDGYGSVIKTYNGQTVYMIDNIATVITSIRKNISAGFILMNDFSINKCYVVKQNNMFAHGKTLKDAFIALENKIFEDMPLQERIHKFIKAHNYAEKYPGTDLFDWHGKLTGSCELGRTAFCIDHDININTAEFTISEFIALTKKHYNGKIIIELENAITENKQNNK